MAWLHGARAKLASAALLSLSVVAPGAVLADDDAPANRASRDSGEPEPQLIAAPDTPESQLAERLQAIWSADPALRRGTTAIYVADAVTGEVLWSVHEDRGLNAASNVKLVSTATALAALGPDFQFRTALLGPAPDADGVVHGDVYLVGSHDMTFHHSDVARMAQELASRGISRINGSVRVSEHPTRDTLARSSVKVAVTGARHGQPPTVEVTPKTSLVRVDASRARSHRRARRRARLRVGSTWSETDEGPKLEVSIRGRIRPGRTRWYFRKVPAPSTFTAHVLTSALTEAGIEVVGPPALGDGKALPADIQQGMRELAVYDSPPLRRLVARINKPSNNFLADRLIENVGAILYGGEPSMEKGVRAMREYLDSIDIDPAQVALDTGSGLSYATSLSARQIARTLRAGAGFVDYDAVRTPSAGLMAAAGGPASAPPDISETIEHRVAFINSLAVAGQDGTLRRRFDHSPAVGQVIGKTGTLTSVIALSGFVSEGDDSLVFALVSNGHGRSRRRGVRDAHERLTEAMLDFLRARAERQLTGAEPCPPLR